MKNMSEINRADLCLDVCHGVSKQKLSELFEHMQTGSPLKDIIDERDRLLKFKEQRDAANNALSIRNSQLADQVQQAIRSRTTVLNALKVLRDAAYNAHADSSCNDALEQADKVIAMFQTAIHEYGIKK